MATGQAASQTKTPKYPPTRQIFNPAGSGHNSALQAQTRFIQSENLRCKTVETDPERPKRAINIILLPASIHDQRFQYVIDLSRSGRLDFSNIVKHNQY